MKNTKTLYADGSTYKTEDGWDTYVAIVLDDGTPNGKLLRHGAIGNHTINEAEYIAVIWALRWSGEHTTVLTDSNLIVGHVYKNWNCVDHLVPYRDEVKALIQSRSSRVRWITRNANKAGKFFERYQKQKRRLRKAE